MNARRVLVPAFVAAAIAVGATTTTPAGPPSAEADLRIKKVGKPYRGNDVVNLTGAGQTVRKIATSGQTAKFKFKVENDGFGAGQIFVRGNGSDPEFKVRYRTFLGANLTPQMLAGTANFNLDAGDEGRPVTILVTPKTSAPLGATKTVRVTATHATTDDDRVRAKVENGLPGE
jgi:hypothetical protein